MRPAIVSALLMILIGICSAQDTNFAQGPQYLITSGSPLFLRPIATPTLSFTAPPSNAGEATTEVAAEEQAAYTPPRIPNTTDVSRIYWGGPVAGENAGEQVNEIELSSEQRLNLPASIVSSGVTEMIDVRALRDRGYAMSVAEAAAFWKTHRTQIAHVYTNVDVARLHGG